MEKMEPGRLAVWRVRNGEGALYLQIDLDCDQAVTLTIGQDGHTTMSLTDRFTEWLAAEARQAA